MRLPLELIFFVQKLKQYKNLSMAVFNYGNKNGTTKPEPAQSWRAASPTGRLKQSVKMSTEGLT